MKANTTIDGQVYAVPHQWGTSGLVADVTKAPNVEELGRPLRPAIRGKTSMRLRRTILLGTAFGMGMDPFALYAKPDEYQKMLDEVEKKLIDCKANVKTYWEGGTDLAGDAALGRGRRLRGVGPDRLQALRAEPEHPYIPPETGALAWIDTFAIPAKGEADDAAYKWINFVMQPDIVPIMSANTGSIAGGEGRHWTCCRTNKKAAVQASFKPKRPCQPEILRQHSSAASRTWKARRWSASRRPPPTD